MANPANPTQKTMTGSRAVMIVAGVPVGIFETVSYSKNYGTEPIHLLGRFSSAEIVYTSAEVVTLTCGAFRVINQGAHVLPKFPKVQDILAFQSITLAVYDRQTGQNILNVQGCVPNSESGAHNARAASRMTVSYQGILADDESGPQGEGSGATNLP